VGREPKPVSRWLIMDPAGSTAAKTTSVLIPIAAATSGDLPDICALTGESAAGRWIRKAQGMTKVWRSQLVIAPARTAWFPEVTAEVSGKKPMSTSVTVPRVRRGSLKGVRQTG
jgi:hypothetical protein